MKQFIGILIVTLIMTSSQASTMSKNGGRYTDTNRYATQQPIVTRSAQARARIQKPKLFVGRPHKVNAYDYDDDFLDADDIITTYRRRDLTKLEHDDEISEKVRWRLFLARQLAMMKYHSLHT